VDKGALAPRSYAFNSPGDIRYRDSFVRILRVRIRWSRSAAKEGFSYQFKNGWRFSATTFSHAIFPIMGK
jgi:hypothetical protein